MRHLAQGRIQRLAVDIGTRTQDLLCGNTLDTTLRYVLCTRLDESLENFSAKRNSVYHSEGGL